MNEQPTGLHCTGSSAQRASNRTSKIFIFREARPSGILTRFTPLIPRMGRDFQVRAGQRFATGTAIERPATIKAEDWHLRWVLLRAGKVQAICKGSGHASTKVMEPARQWSQMTPRCDYYGAQNDYTYMFITLELVSQLHRTSVTHGFLAGILLCNSVPS